MVLCLNYPRLTGTNARDVFEPDSFLLQNIFIVSPQNRQIYGSNVLFNRQ